MRPAISIIVVPGILLLALACSAPPPSATPPSPADAVAPTAAASIPPDRIATEAPTNTSTPAASETPGAPPEPVATAVPTAAVLPSPTPAPAQPTATSAPTPEPPAQPTAANAPTPQPTADPSAVRAEIVDFILPDITIPAGATVTWTNLDQAGHTATSGKDGISGGFDDIAWDSRGLELNESFSFTFVQPGAFPYTCKFHPWMNATVTVEATQIGGTSGAGGGTSGGGDSGY